MIVIIHYKKQQYLFIMVMINCLEWLKPKYNYNKLNYIIYCVYFYLIQSISILFNPYLSWSR